MIIFQVVEELACGVLVFIFVAILIFSLLASIFGLVFMIFWIIKIKNQGMAASHPDFELVLGPHLPQDYILLVSRALVSDGYEMKRATVGEFHPLTFYKKEFHAEKFLTQMNNFFFLSEAEHISRELMMDYAEKCFKWGIKNNKGLPRGFQGGVMTFPVLISRDIDPDAVAWVEDTPRKHFSASEMPVISDLSEGKVHFFKGAPLWGLIYYPTFRKMIGKYMYV